MDRRPAQSVAERLRLLRGGAGPTVPAESPRPVEPLQPSFADRVRRLMGGGERHPSVASDPASLIEALGAEWVAPGVARVERRLGPRLHHGRSVLSVESYSEHRIPDSLLPRGTEGASKRRGGDGSVLYLDTETTGLAGGVGTWVFLTGALRADAGGWLLRQYLLTRLDAEPAYLEAVRGELRGVGILVSYNGRSFDLPLLSTRLRLCGQPDPFPALAHLDLLALVRRAFGRLWSDCRLATVEARLLGLDREGDLPGAAAPAAWLEWLNQRGAHALGGVVRHNRLDLLSLAALIPVLEATLEDPSLTGADAHAVALHHLSRGEQEPALRILKDAREHLDAAGLRDLARLHRRLGEWQEASAIWEGLAAKGDRIALCALAKFYEHQARDIPRALDCALALPPSAEQERRCERLRSKLKGALEER